MPARELDRLLNLASANTEGSNWLVFATATRSGKNWTRLTGNIGNPATLALVASEPRPAENL